MQSEIKLSKKSFIFSVSLITLLLFSFITTLFLFAPSADAAPRVVVVAAPAPIPVPCVGTNCGPAACNNVPSGTCTAGETKCVDSSAGGCTFTCQANGTWGGGVACDDSSTCSSDGKSCENVQ